MRIAITGVGVVSPLGNDVSSYWDGLEGDKAVIRPAPWGDPAAGRHAWISDIADWRPEEFLDDRIVRGTVRFSQFALSAAMDAVEDHGAELDPDRTAIVLGATMAGAAAIAEAQHRFETEGPEGVDRKLNIQVWPNMAAGQVALHYGTHGPLLTVSTACASAIDALGTAARMIEAGQTDVAIAGGSESGMSHVMYWSQQTYGMAGSIEDPSLASVPFDVRRAGIVEGEGAGVVVLEREDHALARGAEIHGYLRGYASLSDGFHPSSPDPSAVYESRAMRAALDDAGISPSDVHGIVAHATSTPVGDAAEIKAINEVYGDAASDLLVSSIKGHVGHTGSASGSMGVIAGLKAMQAGRMFPVANTRQIEPDARFHVVTQKPEPDSLDILQINAFGFGGQDSSLVISGS